MAEGDAGVIAAEVAAERRPIAALEMEGLVPGDPPTRVPEFLWVRPSTLLVDETYQRSLSPKSLKLIRRIIDGWDWARFKPPVVANTPGGLEVIGGQHTAMAAVTHGGILEIPVMVVGAPTVAARAASFVGHNRDRLGLTPGQIHFAAIAAGDPDAAAVELVCSAAGVKLLRYPPSAAEGYKPGDCLAFTTLYGLVTRRGLKGSTRALQILRNADMAPVAAWQIAGIEQLLWSDEYRGAVDADALVEALEEAIERGDSAGDFARVMGGGLTRNAAIGKARRLGLNFRSDIGWSRGIKTASERRSPKPPRPACEVIPKLGPRERSNLGPLPAPKLRVVQTEGRFVGLLERAEHGECKYIVNDPVEGEGAIYCAAVAGEGDAYCPGHMAICYNAPLKVGAKYAKALRKFYA